MTYTWGETCIAHLVLSKAVSTPELAHRTGMEIHCILTSSAVQTSIVRTNLPAIMSQDRGHILSERISESSIERLYRAIWKTQRPELTAPAVEVVRRVRLSW